MYILTGRFHKLFLILLLLSLLAGCSGGGGGRSGNSGTLTTSSPSDPALLTLTSSSAVDVASFSGKSMYVLITAGPDDKPESNDYAETYSFSLSSTIGTSTSQATLSSVKSSTATASTSDATTAFDSAAQNACDQMCRKKENSLLASKAKQFSKSSSSLLKSTAPTGDIKKGDTWKEVWVFSIDNDKFVQIDTTCCYESTYAYIFVDDQDTSFSSSSYAEEYATAFDQIYQVNHKHFGAENDTDQNDKVIIVFSSKLTNGLLGYFYSPDKYAYDGGFNPYSNQGDIIYVTADANYLKYVKGTMAHEFQHMIYFDEHYNKGVINTYTWLNEALSQAAEYYNNDTDLQEARIEYFLTEVYSGLSLTYWTDYNYGFGAIFIRYLIDQYGDTAIKKMCSTKYVGIKAVEQATGVDFNTIFTNFTRALVLSDYSETSSALYKFTTLTLSDYGGLATLASTLTAGSSLFGSENNNGIYPYSINFYSCSGTFGTMTLSGSSVTGTVFGL